MSKKARSRMTPAQKLAALDVDRAYWITQRGAIAEHVLSCIDTAVVMWQRIERGELRFDAQAEAKAEEHTEL